MQQQQQPLIDKDIQNRKTTWGTPYYNLTYEANKAKNADSSRYT